MGPTAPPSVSSPVPVPSASPVVGLAVSVASAGEYVQEWLARPQAAFLSPGPEHVRRTLDLLASVGTGANLTTDAQLAAYALEFDGAIHSNDADFGRFPGVRWVNPLA